MLVMRLLFFFFFVFFFISCKHKSNFSAFPEVGYNKSIEPIIISNCTQSGCHGSDNYEEFELLSYNQLMKNCEIVAGSPDKSKLLKVITSYNNFEVMPAKPYNRLTEKQIELIYVWIGQGAKNN